MYNPDYYIRSKSARRRKRDARTDLEKRVRAAYKEWRHLREVRRNMPLLPLPEPYQKGFVRYFVLREDVARSKRAAFFEELLEVVNTYQYSDNRKFEAKKRRRGKRVLVPRKQELENFIEWTFFHSKSTRYLTEAQRAYFIKVKRYMPLQKEFMDVYEFADPWRFVLRVRPNMITHYRPVDSDLERDIDALDRFVYDRGKREGIFLSSVGGRGGRGWRKVEKKRGKEKHRFKTMHQVPLFRSKAFALEIAEETLSTNYQFKRQYKWEI